MDPSESFSARVTLDKQISVNKEINLFFSDIADLVQIDGRFLADIRVLKERQEELPDELLNHAVDRVREIIYGINQYLQIPPSGFEELKEIYRNSWSLMDHQESSTVIVDHHRRLSAWLRDFYPQLIARELENHRRIGRVVNEQYSPSLQSDILGIRIESLHEPIVDVGCGREARLVRTLRDCGKDAVGLERTGSIDFDFIIVGDWFDFDFTSRRWGTIISHMAFSNHYRHAISTGGDIIGRFAAKYTEMMSSLSPGGSFVYAPSLPEIEAAIDMTGFHIAAKMLPGGYASTRITRWD